MMGERAVAQEALFYSFNLEGHVPAQICWANRVFPVREGPTARHEKAPENHWFSEA
jgi:hypothetical protein